MSLNSKTAEFQKKDVAYLFFITHRRRLYQPSLLQVTTCPLFSTKHKGFPRPPAPAAGFTSFAINGKDRILHKTREQHFVPLKYIYYGFISYLYRLQSKNYIRIYEVFINHSTSSFLYHEEKIN